MKRIALGLMLTAISGPAWGACTLPYTLTNGTVANADQVMANLNAAAACYQTSGGGNVQMALGAAWAKEMVVNGAGITAGTTRSAKAELGAYIGMRMMANTNASFAGRSYSSVSYTVPSGAKAFVISAQFLDEQRSAPNYFGARLFNVTQNRVAAGVSTAWPSTAVPSQSPGTAAWSMQYSGSLSTNAWGNSSAVNAYYPLAGAAGDVLRMEMWTNGDGNYRIQDLVVFLVVVDAVTGNPIP